MTDARNVPDLVAYLRASYDAQAAEATRILAESPSPWTARPDARHGGWHVVDCGGAPVVREDDGGLTEHVARYLAALADARRVLDDLAAKRAILGMWEDAQGAEFPDFDGGWASALDAVVDALASRSGTARTSTPHGGPRDRNVPAGGGGPDPTQPASLTSPPLVPEAVPVPVGDR